ncbi:MAG: nucleotidyl transferase, partial [Ignavibacteriae bacterium]|nr:nucleotidyl transferase [Ignavibacteriota bacterium]
LNVAGKPIIGHILDKIIADGFTEATIIVGYMGEKIKEYVHANYSIKVDFIEQEERKGLAHAIHLAKGTLTDEPFLIILGDTIFDVDLKPVIKSDHTSIGVKYVEDPRRFGITELREGYVSKFIEKPEHPTSNFAIVGLYWIKNPKLLEQCIDELLAKDIRTRGEYQLTDALQLMMERGERIKTFQVDGWYDCGKPETLLSTNRHLLDKQQSAYNIDGVVVVPPVYISNKAKISHSVVGPYATIAANTIVADSVIRNSIVSEDAQVFRSVLDNSIIGNHAMVKGAFKRINVGDSSEIDFY